MNEKVKRTLIYSLFFAVVLAIIWFGKRRSETPVGELQIPNEQSGSKPARTYVTGKTKTLRPASVEQLPRLEMKEDKYEIDPVASAIAVENPPFEFRGDGTSGMVIDQKGAVIMDSDKGIGIFGIEVGPDKQHVLVKGGDAIYFVLNPTIGLKIQLPVFPPDPNVLAIGGWRWIGKSKLLGDSCLKADAGEGDAPPKLYVYDLKTQKLAEVAVPSKVTQPVFSVTDVSTAGHVHLIQPNPDDATDQDLGWFKIQLDNENE